MNDSELTDSPDSMDDADGDDTDSPNSMDDTDGDDTNGTTLSTMSEGFASSRLKPSLQDRTTQIVIGVTGVLVIVVIIGLLRACGNGDDAVESLLSVAEDVGETLTDHADEVGDDDLYREADRIIDAERDLRRNTEIDSDDIDDLEDFGDDAARFARSIYWYMVTAAEISIWSASLDQDTSDAALRAARKAGEYLTNDSALSIGRSLAESMLETELEERARRDDDESAEEYREATNTLLDATETAMLAEVDYWITGAETAIEVLSSDNRDARARLEESMDDSYNRKLDADEEFERAVDDFIYYRGRVSWRDLEYFEPRLPW